MVQQHQTNPVEALSNSSAKKIRYRGAIWTLILLAPFISEVLSGSTRLSVLFVYIPEVMVWGVGALLCRELVRRWRGGGTSLLLMGLALSVAEEFLIQQTSLAPLPFPGSHAEYGRVVGVNLVYLLFMLGFESVWVVVVPVQVTELMFGTRARAPWLRTRGLIVCCVFFLLGCRIAWYGWTQQARLRLGAAAYHPPAALLGMGSGAILVLVWSAYALRNIGRVEHDDRRRTLPAWVGGATAFAGGAAWWAVITQVFVPKPFQPWWLVVVAGVLWALTAYSVFTAWSSRAAWGPKQRWAAAFGATLGVMISPYLNLAGWGKAELAAQVIFGLTGIVMFLLVGKRLRNERASELES